MSKLMDWIIVNSPIVQMLRALEKEDLNLNKNKLNNKGDKQ